MRRTTDPLKVHLNVAARLHSTQIICYIVVLKVLKLYVNR